MNQRGKETVLTAYLILITVALFGGLLTYRMSLPTGAAAYDSGNPVVSINSFDAVFDPDGVTSFKLAASAKENIDVGLAGEFILSFETAGKTMQYKGFVFFDGAFGEIRSMEIKSSAGKFEAEDVKGTVVVTNAIDDTATILVKADFKRPVSGSFFEPPSKVLINFGFTAYDAAYSSKMVPVRYSNRPIPFPYYLNNFGIIEINV